MGEKIRVRELKIVVDPLGLVFFFLKLGAEKRERYGTLEMREADDWLLGFFDREICV